MSFNVKNVNCIAKGKSISEASMGLREMGELLLTIELQPCAMLEKCGYEPELTNQYKCKHSLSLWMVFYTVEKFYVATYNLHLSYTPRS